VDPTDDKANFRGHVPTESSRPIQLGGSVLGPPRHICAFFNSRDDEYRVLLPFIKDGLECGEKAVHTVDPQRRDEHLRRLAKRGQTMYGFARMARSTQSYVRTISLSLAGTSL
jgi:MEDS: MEthanogen/methylotroph, DcmR Sensory domain